MSITTEASFWKELATYSRGENSSTARSRTPLGGQRLEVGDLRGSCD
jgi:hypothetical protein